jgi:cytochrome b subunit of formate dehydrogenase
MKNSALKFINPILALMFVLTVTFVALYKFGPASLRGSESMGELHEFAGAMFFFVAVIHIYFNWGWIRTNILGKKAHHKAAK